MNRACIVDVGELFDFAKNNYNLHWNASCRLFEEYYEHDNFKHLEPMCSTDIVMEETNFNELSKDEQASRIVEEFISTLDVPEGYDLMVEG